MNLEQDRPITDLKGGPSLVKLIFGDRDTLSNTRVSRGMPEGLYCTSRCTAFTCWSLGIVTLFDRTVCPYIPTKESSCV